MNYVQLNLKLFNLGLILISFKIPRSRSPPFHFLLSHRRFLSLPIVFSHFTFASSYFTFITFSSSYFCRLFNVSLRRLLSSHWLSLSSPPLILPSAPPSATSYLLHPLPQGGVACGRQTNGEARRKRRIERRMKLCGRETNGEARR